MEPSADWDDDELPPRRRRSPLLAVLAVVVVLALVAGIVEIAFDRTSDDDASTIERARPAGPPPSPTEMQQVVAEISDFVAAARGLPFKRPVDVTLLGDDAFGTRVAEDALEDEKALADTEAVLHAVSLLPDDVSLVDVLRSFLAAGVVGFYDPETNELVVRGAAITPYVRVTLSHELTHALDDQHFELDRPVLDDADDESGFAFSSLVEGNAVRIQEQYKATLSEGDRKDADAEEARIGLGLDLTTIPRVVPELIGFPYGFGPRLVAALVDAGGEARVNEAFAKPPITSEQVVVPEQWLAGAAPPIDVPPPQADGEVFDQGTIGFWGVYLILEEELGQEDATRAALGWGGDWYVAWRDGDSTCVRATFAMDTAGDLEELADGLDQWAGGEPRAEVTRAGDRVTFTSCD